MNDIAEPALALIAYQIALALHYLHEVQSVAHCDLKMGNILLHGKLIVIS